MLLSNYVSRHGQLFPAGDGFQIRPLEQVVISDYIQVEKHYE